MQCDRCGATIDPDEACERLINRVVARYVRSTHIEVDRVQLCRKCARRYDGIYRTAFVAVLLMVGFLLLLAVLGAINR